MAFFCSHAFPSSLPYPRSLASLAESQKSECASGEARGGGGLGALKPCAISYAGAGGVERSRATDAASSEAIGTPAEPLGLLNRVATGPLHGGRATQRGLTATT
jgi:hypothetical protein